MLFFFGYLACIVLGSKMPFFSITGKQGGKDTKDRKQAIETFIEKKR